MKRIKDRRLISSLPVGKAIGNLEVKSFSSHIPMNSLHGLTLRRTFAAQRHSLDHCQESIEMRGTLSCVMAGLLAGCATVPASLSGDFAHVEPTAAVLPDTLGQRVRWGGRVTGARDVGDRMCLEVMSMPLEQRSKRPDDGYPYAVRQSGVPFLACNDFSARGDWLPPGSMITITGTIASPAIVQVTRDQCQRFAPYGAAVHASDSEKCVVGVATVAVSTTYLWPERPSFDPDRMNIRQPH